MYISTGLGGAVGCIIGGLVTQYSHPKWCWLAFAFVGLLVVIMALFLTK
jgi:predicted MFS family arabinose efflux permease